MPTFSDHDILETFREVVRTEAQALEFTSRSIDARAATAVHLIRSAKGKVVTLGVGKSGFVARKIASTLASTGTLALFLHPTEAAHGDLGLVDAADVILAFSKSGESKEINILLDTIKTIGATIIAITGNEASTLGRAADVVLPAVVSREACPLDLAPTSSVVVALALGDALAISLMRLKGFKEKDFAQIHPGGSLGKKLLQKIGDIMIEKVRCAPVRRADLTIDTVLAALGENLLGLVPVVDDADRLIGVITDGDLRRALKNHREKVFTLDLQTIWNTHPFVCQATDLANDVLAQIQKRERPLNVVPVVTGDRFAGVVRVLDIFS